MINIGQDVVLDQRGHRWHGETVHVQDVDRLDETAKVGPVSDYGSTQVVWDTEWVSCGHLQARNKP